MFIVIFVVIVTNIVCDCLSLPLLLIVLCNENRVFHVTSHLEILSVSLHLIKCFAEEGKKLILRVVLLSLLMCDDGGGGI